MKSLTLFFFLFIYSFSFSQPKISIVEGTSHDWGTMYKGEVMDKKLTIKNVGTDTLVIASVNASCGCTAAMLSEKIIPPQKTGNVSISFNSQNFSGKVKKNVTITSNDKDDPSLIVSFGINILEELVLNPKILVFRDLKKGEQQEQTIVVKNNSDSIIAFQSWKSENKNLDVQFPQTGIAPGKEGTLTVKFNAVDVGNVNTILEITTNAKHLAKLPVNVYANIIEKKQ